MRLAFPLLFATLFTTLLTNVGKEKVLHALKRYCDSNHSVLAEQTKDKVHLLVF
jgi:hypothetical protein